MVWQLIPILITAIGAGLAVGAIIYLVTLTIERIRNWFREKRRKSMNLSKTPFTLKEELEGGRVKFVQGFFDRETGNVSESETYSAENVDSELEELHRTDKVVVYS